MREKPELTHPPEKDFDRKEADQPVELPNPDLNPMVNQTLGRNLGRWAQVYVTSAPENRDRAVGDLLRELEGEGGAAQRKGPRSEKSPRPTERRAGTPSPELADGQQRLVERDEAPPALEVVACGQCHYENSLAQSFCGMCGAALRSAQGLGLESAPAQGPVSPPDNVDWLREQPLAGFRAAEVEDEEERGFRGKALAIVMALLIVFLSGYAWWSRSHADAHPSTPRSAPSVSKPAVEANPAGTPPPSVRKRAQERAVEETLPAQLKGDSKHAVVEPKERASTKTPASEEKPGEVSEINSTNGNAELATAQGYLYGANGRKDTGEAAKWLWKSVSKQNRTALLLLADLYERGDGVTKSCGQAQLLLVAAAKKGLPEAGERLRYLQSSGCK